METITSARKYFTHPLKPEKKNPSIDINRKMLTGFNIAAVEVRSMEVPYVSQIAL